MRRPSESPTELQSELPSESPTQHAASLGVTHHLTRASGCGARNLAMVAHVTSRACSCGARRPTRVAHVTSPAWRTSPHQRGGASVGSPEWRTWRSSPHALPAVSCCAHSGVTGTVARHVTAVLGLRYPLSLCRSWRHWDGRWIRYRRTRWRTCASTRARSGWCARDRSRPSTPSPTPR